MFLLGMEKEGEWRCKMGLVNKIEQRIYKIPAFPEKIQQTL